MTYAAQLGQVLGSRELYIIPAERRRYAELLKSPIRSIPFSFRFVQAPAPFFSQKGTLAVTDNAQPAVTAELSRVTIQVSDNQPTLEQLVLWDLLNVLDQKDQTSEHILAYLAKQRDAEVNAWLWDDIQIAWLTVLFAARGYEQPHVNATYQTLGVHPNKVWAKICRNREAILGSLAKDPAFAQDMVGMALTASPKKRPHRVKPLVQKAAAGGD